jgi:hypothetical protein
MHHLCTVLTCPVPGKYRMSRISDAQCPACPSASALWRYVLYWPVQSRKVSHEQKKRRSMSGLSLSFCSMEVCTALTCPVPGKYRMSRRSGAQCPACPWASALWRRCGGSRGDAAHPAHTSPRTPGGGSLAHPDMVRCGFFYIYRDQEKGLNRGW